MLSAQDLWPSHLAQIYSREGLKFGCCFLQCWSGWRGDPARACICETHEIRAYMERLRESVQGCFDLQVEVALRTQELLSRFPEQRSLEVYRRGGLARDQQASRYAESYLQFNADLGSIGIIQQYCLMDTPAETLLREAIGQLRLTPGQLPSLQRVARTIADLAGRERIGAPQMAEAGAIGNRL